MRSFRVAACFLLAHCGEPGEPARGVAYVTILQDRTAARGTFDATFLADPDAFWAQCNPATHGPCVTYACPSDAHAALLAAGTLSIQGGPIRGTVRVSPDPGDYYAEDFGGRLQFHAGDAFTVSGAGADVSSFAATVVMPALALLSRPDVSQPLSTAADVAVAWTGGEPDADVVVEIFDDASHTTCTFPANDATATIPRDALAAFAGRRASFQWQQQRDALVYAGSFPIHFVAVNSASAEVAWQ